MSILNKVISKVFGKKSDKDIKKLSPIVEQINLEFSKLEKLTDDELKAKFSKIQSDLHHIIKNKESDLIKKDLTKIEIDKELQIVEKQYLDDKMVEVFAIVKDVARRLCGT